MYNFRKYTGSTFNREYYRKEVQNQKKESIRLPQFLFLYLFMKKIGFFHQHPDPQNGSRVFHFSSPAEISATTALIPEQESGVSVF